jgi:hypothetical protein
MYYDLSASGGLTHYLPTFLKTQNQFYKLNLHLFNLISKYSRYFENCYQIL